MAKPSQREDHAEGHFLNADIARQRRHCRPQSTDEHPQQEKRQEHGQRGRKPVEIASQSHAILGSGKYR